jgi:LytS/YehU family sensor histidine kinase
MLHDSKSDQVSIEKELEHVENYISLERLRIKNEKFLKFNISGNYQGIRIAPMLFIQFVENAFKHSVDSEIENGIVIDFAFEKNTITFICENQYNNLEIEKDKTHGIGLEIVEKRLKLLYPDKHKLNIDKDSPIFKVRLEINLDEN